MAMKLNKTRALFICLAVALSSQLNAFGHERKSHSEASASYLGNEGVLISSAVGDVLFDPFFHNDYGSYQLVPEKMRDAIFNAQAPYDDVRLVIVSHAHGDHFSAEDSLKYLQKNQSTKLIAPKQAIASLLELPGSDSVASRLVSIDLTLGEAAKAHQIGDIEIESVRIPHAGWPGRKEIENLVHRVTFGRMFSVIHMGDADPNDIHFKPYKALWDKRNNHLAFPPYWFFTSGQGLQILDERLKARHSIGVHVPVKIPDDLRQSGNDYFSKPGEIREIKPNTDH